MTQCQEIFIIDDATIFLLLVLYVVSVYKQPTVLLSDTGELTTFKSIKMKNILIMCVYVLVTVPEMLLLFIMLSMFIESTCDCAVADVGVACVIGSSMCCIIFDPP